jgi:hypothetical protein
MRNLTHDAKGAATEQRQGQMMGFDRMFEGAADVAAVDDPEAQERPADDAFVAAEEATTNDAINQAGLAGVAGVIDRSAVDVPVSFALDAPRFFVADPRIVVLANAKEPYAASPKWHWFGGARNNQFL